MKKQIFNYTVKEPSFTLIKNGIKKIEGRLFKNSFRKIKRNDIILFRNDNRFIETEVIHINHYNIFFQLI